MGPVKIGAKRIVPSRFQAPPRPNGARASGLIEPPSMSIRFSSLFAKKPIERLSGDQKGRTAPIPCLRGAVPTPNRWAEPQLGLTLRDRHKRDLQAVRRNRERLKLAPARVPLEDGVVISSRICGAAGPERAACQSRTVCTAAISVASANADANQQALLASRRGLDGIAVPVRSGLRFVNFNARVGDVMKPTRAVLLQAPAQQTSNTVGRFRRELTPVRF